MCEVVLKREVMKDNPSSMICSRSGAVKPSRAMGARASFGAIVDMGRGGNGGGRRRRGRRRRGKERIKRGRENTGKERILGVTQTGVGIPYTLCTVSPRSQKLTN